MKKFIHIRCKIPAKVSINGAPSSTNPDIITDSDFYMAFFPLKNNYLPYALSTSGNFNSDIVKVIPFVNNHYEIIYNPASTPQSNTEQIILNKKYKNCFFTISNSGNSYINIKSKNYNHSSTCETIKFVEFKVFEDYVIILGNISHNKHYVLIFNTITHKIVIESIANQIESTKKHIKLLKKHMSYMGYATISEFNFQSKKLSSFNILSNKSHQTSDFKIIPQLFLECVKFKDFKTAKNFLSNPNIQDLQLAEYFGEISEIYFNGYTDDANYTIFTDEKYRNFTFSFIDNKIADIEENKLKTI